MINNESKKNSLPENPFGENVCDLRYLGEMMGNKKHLIKKLLDIFLEQIPEELKRINDAIESSDYVTIKNVAHTIKSSVSIVGITILVPVLQEMEMHSIMKIDLKKIRELNVNLNLICKKAINEIQMEQSHFE